jgi:hypothetical protein
MALKVDASFEDGVFVPAHRPSLANRERVRLTIEPMTRAVKNSSVGEGPANPGSRTDHNMAIALDFHPDGC